MFGVWHLLHFLLDLWVSNKSSLLVVIGDGLKGWIIFFIPVANKALQWLQLSNNYN